MNDNEILLSAEGLKKMEEELDNLKTTRRKEVAMRIKQAIEFGDISENSEYEDAKNEQAFIEGSIISLEQKLRNVRLIDMDDIDIQKVSVGSSVRYYDYTHEKEQEYTIVSSVEADPFKKRISNESPIGAGLLGKKVGEETVITVPAGKIHVKILEIHKQ
ncbi:MAG: transcription elongation factor GreA [Clostridia bacterium]|nr:transcription elongation factor GreA [Clostridia bacterium]MDD4798440.1 transcription elongation factor GreA [Clostridia bacterium]